MGKQRYFMDGVIGDNNGSPGLIAHKCQACGKKSFPLNVMCPYCGSDKLQNVFLGNEATVLCATTTRAAVPPYKPPFTLAIVDFDEDVRTIGRVEKDDSVQLKKGDKLTLKFGKFFEETETDRKTKEKTTIDVNGYYFVPKK